MKAKHLIILAILGFNFTACNDEVEYIGLDEDLQSEFASSTDEIREANQKELDETGEISEETLRNNEEKLMKAARELERNAKGDHGKLASIQREFFETLIAKNKPIQKQGEALMRAIDFSNADVRNNLDKGLLEIEKTKKISQEYIDFVNVGMDETIVFLLDKYEVEGRAKEEFLRGMKSSLGGKKGDLIAVRQYDIDVCNEYARLINILKDKKDKWTWSEAKQNIEFTADTEDATLDKVNAIYTKIQEIALKQQAAERKMRGLK